MPSTIIKKSATHLYKDVVTGCVSKISVYGTSLLPRPIGYVFSLQVVTPDVFELELTPGADLIDLINYQVNTLKFDAPLEPKCPICGNDLFRLNSMEYSVCLNIDCHTNDDIVNDIARKLMTLIPNVNFSSINYWCSLLDNDNIPISVTNIIKYISNMYIEGNVDPQYINGTVDLINAVKFISVTEFFNLCTILDISDELDMLVVAYDNNILNLITDVINSGAKSLELSLDNRLIDLVKKLVVINIPFLDAIKEAYLIKDPLRKTG